MIEYCSPRKQDIALDFAERQCWSCNKMMPESQYCPLKGLTIPEGLTRD